MIHFIWLVVIQVFSGGIFIGGLVTSIKSIEKSITELKEHIKEDINRLEIKQDKHNGLIERMVVVEESTKCAHHRLDDMKKVG